MTGQDNSLKISLNEGFEKKNGEIGCHIYKCSDITIKQARCNEVKDDLQTDANREVKMGESNLSFCAPPPQVDCFFFFVLALVNFLEKVLSNTNLAIRCEQYKQMRAMIAKNMITSRRKNFHSGMSM